MKRKNSGDESLSKKNKYDFDNNLKRKIDSVDTISTKMSRFKIDPEKDDINLRVEFSRFIISWKSNMSKAHELYLTDVHTLYSHYRNYSIVYMPIELFLECCEKYRFRKKLNIK